MKNNKLILLVEDDVSLAQWISEYLQKHHYDVVVEHRGDQAIKQVEILNPDLIILDLMLPGKNGFDICRELKPVNPAPILMLTAKDDEVDQIVGLELGADDYVIKPVKPRLLLTRIQVLLRRYYSEKGRHSVDVVNQLNFGELMIDDSSRELSYKNTIIPLSGAEYDLLWLLVNSPGKPLSRDEILQSLRGINYDGLDRSIDTRVSQLRRKLHEYTGRAENIKTVRGKGYMFVADNWI